jgi:hypothetical protein
MIFALASLLTVFGVLALLALLGWFATVPFARMVPHPMAVAPMAGLMLWPAATLLLYVGVGAPLPWAAGLAAGALALASLAVAAWTGWPQRDVLVPRLILLLGLAAATTLLCMSQALRLGEPALLFLDGTDQAGYAQVADWLTRHRVGDRLFVDADHPYHSWPAGMLQWDPRFGTFTLIALIGLLFQVRGLFAIDPTCAVVLAAAALATAGVFAQQRQGFLLLVVGLVIGQWYDLGRTGFLGKMTGYPAALVVAGLLGGILANQPVRSPVPAMAALAALALAAGILYPGLAVAFLVAAVTGGTLAMQGLLGETRPSRDGILAALLTILCIAMASGQIARPLGSHYPETSLSLPAVAGSLLGLHASPAAILAVGLAWAAALALAFGRRDHRSLGVLAVAVLLPSALVLAGALDAAAQLVGFAAPALLTGMASTGEATGRRRPWPLLALAAVIAMSLPRFAATVQRHGGADVDPLYLVTQSDMAALAEAIGREPTLVEVAEPPQLPIALMVHAAEDLALRYTPASWRTIIDYRHWPPPTYAGPATYRIVRADREVPPELIRLRNRQFLLLGHGGGWDGSWQVPRVAVAEGMDLGTAAREVHDMWADGWVGPRAETTLAGGRNDRLRIRLQIPDVGNPVWRTEVTVAVNAKRLDRRILGPGDAAIDIALPDSETARRVELRFSDTQPLAPPDTRRVGARLIEFGLVAGE